MATGSGIVLNISAYHTLVFTRTYFSGVFLFAHMFLAVISHLPSAKPAYCHCLHFPASLQASPVSFYSRGSVLMTPALAEPAVEDYLLSATSPSSFFSVSASNLFM